MSSDAAPKWLNTAQAAAALEMQPADLEALRAQTPYQGPPYYTRGKFFFYKPQDLEDWLMASGLLEPDESWERVVPDGPPPTIDEIYADEPPKSANVAISEPVQGEVLGHLKPVDPRWKDRYRGAAAADASLDQLEKMQRSDDALVAELRAQGRIGPKGEILEPRNAPAPLPTRGDMVSESGMPMPDPLTSGGMQIDQEDLVGVGPCPPTIATSAMAGERRILPNGQVAGGSPLPKVNAQGNELHSSGLLGPDGKPIMAGTL